MKRNKEELSLLHWGRWCHVSEGQEARSACVSPSLGQDNVCKLRRREPIQGGRVGVGWRAQSPEPLPRSLQNSEAGSKSSELGNILLIWKNKSEGEGMVCGHGGVATGD